WPARRHDDDFERWSRFQSSDGIAGFPIVGFQNDFDIELRQRVIEPPQRADKVTDPGCLTIERDNDRVDRQRRIRCSRRLLFWWTLALQAEQPQAGPGKEDQTECVSRSPVDFVRQNCACDERRNQAEDCGNENMILRMRGELGASPMKM